MSLRLQEMCIDPGIRYDQASRDGEDNGGQRRSGPIYTHSHQYWKGDRCHYRQGVTIAVTAAGTEIPEQHPSQTTPEGGLQTLQPCRCGLSAVQRDRQLSHYEGPEPFFVVVEAR